MQEVKKVITEGIPVLLQKSMGLGREGGREEGGGGGGKEGEGGGRREYLSMWSGLHSQLAYVGDWPCNSCRARVATG